MNSKPLAFVEADLFGLRFAFHQKTMILLRESSLDEDKQKIVAHRIKKLLDDAIAGVKATQQVNVADRLDMAFEEARRLVGELSHSDDKIEKARPRTRRAVSRKNKR